MKVISRIWRSGLIGKIIVLVFGCMALGIVSGVIRSIGGTPQPTAPVAPVALVKAQVTILAPSATVAKLTIVPPTATNVPPTPTNVPEKATVVPPTATNMPATEAPAVAATDAMVVIEQPTSAPVAAPQSNQPITPSFSGEGASREVSPPYWPCSENQIKGNNGAKEKIYHVPGGQFYARTFDDVKCFDTAQQAEADGYRASKR